MLAAAKVSFGGRRAQHVDRHTVGPLIRNFLNKKSLYPLPRALRAEQGYRVRMRFIFARSALGRESGGGLGSLKKSPSVSNVLLSYDQAHTIGAHSSFECPLVLPADFLLLLL